MIKLERKEIKEMEDRIWGNINDSNRFYFAFDRKGYSDEGYLMNGYYINLNRVNDVWWLGIIKVEEKSSLRALHSVFTELLREKKVLGLWRHKDLLTMQSLHNRVAKMHKSVQGAIGDIVYTIVKR